MTRAPVWRRARGFVAGLAAIVAAGVAIRVVQTLVIAPWPPTFFNDEAYYSALARMLAQGTGFIRPAQWLGDHLAVPTAERPPLYPLVLAGLAKLGATSSDAQRLLSTVTGGGTIAVLGLLGRRLAGPRAGLLAAGLAAVYPVLIAADGALMTESLYGLLAAGSLLAAYRLLDAPGRGRAIVLGAVAALAALARSEAVLLFVLVLVPIVRRDRGLRAAAVACLTFLAVLAPWTVRNAVRFHRPVLIATEGGETLAGANCAATYQGPDLGAWTPVCVHFSGRGNEAATLDALGHAGVRYATHHLGRVPFVIAARLGRTWGVYRPRQVVEGRRRWVMDLGAAAFFALVPLAAYGWAVLRRRLVPVWICTMPFITVTVMSVLGYGTVRFRHTAELAIVVLGAVGLDRLVSRRHAARAGRLGRDAPRPSM